MDLFEKIKICSEDELVEIAKNAVEEKNRGAEKNKRLGFEDGALSTALIPPHKGFISLDSRIKYSNGSLFTYSMKTDDYFYDFSKYIKNKKIQTKGGLVKEVENFINLYFGNSKGIDIRDDYYNSIALNTETDEEMWGTIENFSIGDLKGKKIAMCTERAALAQNLLSLFDFEVYYCMGCINNNGKYEPHCFNIARANGCYRLLDYSLPVPVIYNKKIYDYAPFQGDILIDEIEKFLLNGVDKSFENYEYFHIDNKIQKIPINSYRIYKVGQLMFEDKKTK